MIRLPGRPYMPAFRMWNAADGLSGTAAWSSYGLAFSTESAYSLTWDEPNPSENDLGKSNLVAAYPGLGLRPTPSKRGAAAAAVSAARRARPGILLGVEVRHRDCPGTDLPADHAYWLRDAQGDRVAGWAEGGYYRLDPSKSAFRAHFAARTRGLMQTGLWDFAFFDWWDTPTADMITMLTGAVAALSPTQFAVLNIGMQRPASSVALAGGVVIEGGWMATILAGNWPGVDATEEAAWAWAEGQIAWAMISTREPHAVCIELWGSRGDTARATRLFALAAKHGAYGLFADPNALPAPDHQHGQDTLVIAASVTALNPA